MAALFAMPSLSTELTLTKDNTILMSDAFSGNSTAVVMKKLMDLNEKLKPNTPIYLVLDTPGGSIQAGLELINMASGLGREVHTLTIFAASMGFHTVQGLSKRYILEDGTLMSHKAFGVFFGEFPGQIDSRYTRYLKRINSMNERVVQRTNGQYTLESYGNLIENEYWCDGQSCVDAGFADEVVTASCDSTLAGTRRKLFRRQLVRKSPDTLDFHVIEIVDVFSKCPLITGWLSWNIIIDGSPVFSSIDEESTGATNHSNILNEEIIKIIAEHGQTRIREDVILTK